MWNYMCIRWLINWSDSTKMHGATIRFILPLISQYIISLLIIIVNSKNQFQMNSEVHNINTRNKSDFYQPLSHLTNYHKGPFYVGIKLYNSLPPEMKDLSHNIQKFKSSLRGFHHQHSFYTLEEYFKYKADVWYNLTTKLYLLFSLLYDILR